MTAIGMIAVGLGLTLVWCGIRDEDIRVVVSSVFTGNTPPRGAPAGQGIAVGVPNHTAASSAAGLAVGVARGATS